MAEPNNHHWTVRSSESEGKWKEHEALTGAGGMRVSDSTTKSDSDLGSPETPVPSSLSHVGKQVSGAPEPQNFQVAHKRPKKMLLGTHYYDE